MAAHVGSHRETLPARTGTKMHPRAADVLTQGERILGFAKVLVGEEAISHKIESGERLRLPPHFWKACSRVCFNRQWSESGIKALRKALCSYIAAVRSGAKTKSGMLGKSRPHQRRSQGGALNALKCPELGALLYDWFIDCLHVLHARATNQLLLHQARVIRVPLLDTGYQPQDAPNLDGPNGNNWMWRWRARYSVKSRRTVKHLKVSCTKLKQHIRVFIKNVFALRF